MKQIGFRNNGSIVIAEGELVVGIVKGMMAVAPAYFFFLGAMRPSISVESSVESLRHKNFKGESCGERIVLGFFC